MAATLLLIRVPSLSLLRCVDSWFCQNTYLRPLDAHFWLSLHSSLPAEWIFLQEYRQLTSSHPQVAEESLVI